jgi:hypothetical protein
MNSLSFGTTTCLFTSIAELVEALHYKYEGRGFDSDEVIGSFNWPNPSNSTWPWGQLRFLTEMSTRNLPGGKGRPARKANSLTGIREPIV